jgi:hypothetical protein
MDLALFRGFIKGLSAETSTFSHPDCTVGPGISPDQQTRIGIDVRWLRASASNKAVTAGQEFHLAPKVLLKII